MTERVTRLLAVSSATLGVALLLGGSSFFRQFSAESAGFATQPSPTTKATSGGCGPSTLQIVDGGSVGPGERLSEAAQDRPLGTAGGAIDLATEALAIVPTLPARPGSRLLQFALYNGTTGVLSLAYSQAGATPRSSTFDFLGHGGFALTERPYSGQDGTEVYDSVSRNRWYVNVGSYQAALVWADPYASNLRPFGLYWSDGTREFILIGAPVSPNELVDFARSIECP